MPSLPSENRADTVDLAVVGAGPAGLAAAVTVADAGLAVAVLDLGPRVGGQYYRHAADETGDEDSGAHHNWSRFVRLRERFEGHVRGGRVEHLAEHAVWSVDRRESLVVRAIVGEREREPREVHARRLVVATGAYDRQLPFPGWTLPGVMAAGAAQALLKEAHVPAGRRVVVAGTGPFVLSVADGLLAAGVEVAAVVEANAPFGYARRPLAVAGAYDKLPEVLGYAARLVRDRVPYLVRHAVTAAHGDGRLNSVTISRLDDRWSPLPGRERTVACDTLAVGYGFVPQIDLLLALGSACRLGSDGSLSITVDADQRTSTPGVYAAGETAGVGGADVAEVEGRLAGAAVVRELTGAPGLQAREVRRLRARQKRLRRFAEVMKAVHPVRDGWTGWLDDSTVVCRCEEVAHAGIREAVRELGATSPRVVKLMARPGMGWCQGRMCAMPTATIAAELLGRTVTQQDLEGVVGRTISQPVPLGALAAAGESGEAD
jgi:NADPH-dependent 2,4-dienoyl-CoA reductase/sulfur reductase-like enzyme